MEQRSGARELPQGTTAPYDSNSIDREERDQSTRVIPPTLNGGKYGFHTFQNEFLLKANNIDLSHHLEGEGTRVVPVGDRGKSRETLLAEGYSHKKIKQARQAWGFVDASLKSQEDRAVL